MTTRDPKAAMCAEQLRELLHWAGPKCSGPEDCPGVDDCCYAEGLPTLDQVRDALAKWRAQDSPARSDEAAAALCAAWVDATLILPAGVGKHVQFDALTEDGRDVWRGLVRVVASALGPDPVATTKAERQRDSLARRLALRFEETQRVRAERDTTRGALDDLVAAVVSGIDDDWAALERARALLGRDQGDPHV